jgi:hydrogenase nickel incorporation protein HypA/HybF
MHEMSIASSIVEIAESEAKKANAMIISEIELDIGTISGIELDALDFAFKALKPKSMLKDAEIKINIIQAKAKCEDCKTEFDTENVYTLCPKCNSYKTSILQGKEMKVKSILVD